jgi:hypothetical protein
MVEVRLKDSNKVVYEAGEEKAQDDKEPKDEKYPCNSSRCPPNAFLSHLGINSGVLLLLLVNTEHATIRPMLDATGSHGGVCSVQRT